MYPLTPWVKKLLVANLVAYFVTMSVPQLYQLLLLYPPWVLRRPWTLVSYMFLHAGLGHLFFNMLGLFFFGPRLEERLGSKGFLWLYLLSGVGGAVFSLIFARHAPVVGASAAVYGVLLGFAMFWPRERIYIWGVLPVEAWLLATLLVLGSLWAGINPASGSRIAHFAHLGGLAFAYAYLKARDMRLAATRRAFQRKMEPHATRGGVSGRRDALERWQRIPLQRLHELNREEVERLLRKIDESGVESLTPGERAFLDRMADTT